MPPPSASAARFADHWVANALAGRLVAGDETLDFSVIKELVGVSPESFASAPEATRETVALRCLKEVVAVSAEGEAAVAGGEMLRVDATRSYGELLLELIEQVGSPGSLEKDMLPPLSENVQNFICTKIPTLPEASFELLREVCPEITYMVPPSPLKTSGKNNGNDQSFCSSSHDHANTEKHGCPRDSSDLQRENLTVFANETDTRDAQKNPMEPIPDSNEPSTLYRSCYNQPQENTIGASVRSAEKSLIIDDRNISITAEPASATCGNALLRSNTELTSKKDAVVTTMSQEKSPTTNLQPGSCAVQYQNQSHNNDGETPHDDGTNIQSSKDLSHQGSAMQATLAPDSVRSTDGLPRYTSEKNHLPEFVAADDTAMIARPLGRKTRNSTQHDPGEKASQDLDEGTFRIQLAAADLEVSCADKANPSLQDDGNILKKNTSCGGQTAIDIPCCNVALHNKSSDDDSLSEKNTKKNMADRSVRNSPQNGNKEETKRAANKKIMGNAVVETSNLHCSDDSSSGYVAASLLPLKGNIPSSTQGRDANSEGFTEQDLCVKCGKDGQLLKCNRCSLAAHDSCFGSSVTFDVSGQFYCPVCFYTKATDAYQKAKTAYREAWKNLSAFLGTKQFTKQHDEQSTGKQPAATSSKYHSNECTTSKRQGNHQSEAHNLSDKDEEPGQWRKKQRTNDTSDACPEEDQLNGCNTSEMQGNDQSEADILSYKEEQPGQQSKKQRTNDTNDACPEEDQLNGCNTSIRQGNHQSGAYNLSHKDLEPGQQRKKQKTNATADTCTEEVVTEKAAFGLNSDIATKKDCVLQYKGKKVHVAEHEQPVDNAEACEDANASSFNEAQHSSQNRRSPVTSQNVEADKHDGRTNSHECENPDEIEATSSNDSGKRSSPPWRNMRQHKAKLQQKQTVVSNNSKKALGCQDEHMPSPSRKRSYAIPHKRYSNRVVPVGRRSKLCWTEEEERALRDAMLKFKIKDDVPIPWVQILEYGRDVFHRTRLPSDLRVKWRNMKKKS
ncbi:unnamed protein product [Alopecurus aequalis]